MKWCDPDLMVNTMSVTRSHDAHISLQRNIVANSEARDCCLKLVASLLSQDVPGGEVS